MVEEMTLLQEQPGNKDGACAHGKEATGKLW